MNRPNIIISKCLNFDKCRFNWDMVNDDFLLKLWEFVNYIPVCPEVAIWLSTPRLPLRLYKEDYKTILIQPWTDTDLSEKMRKFSKTFLASQKNIDWFVLKNRSPSCWINDVKLYDKKVSHTFARRWKWSFTQNIDSFFNKVPQEDEWRLKNFRLREEFLTKIFCLADFREVKNQKNIKILQDFQAKNKYLFMFYSPLYQKELWKIIASYNKENLSEILEDYNIKLLELFSVKTNTWKMINALTHIFWYFKNTCSKEEKEFFLETLEVYREWRIPASSVVSMLKLLALKDNSEYVLNQTILNPFPKKLIELSDSWKLLNL